MACKSNVICEKMLWRAGKIVRKSNAICKMFWRIEKIAWKNKVLGTVL